MVLPDRAVEALTRPRRDALRPAPDPRGARRRGNSFKTASAGDKSRLRKVGNGSGVWSGYRQARVYWDLRYGEISEQA